ncbi:C5a anaphylatoxin chemotactic receptor 1 [Thamnophis elegans]|uniref:C5a anaphylatoxin chemotactic receptor 1 n=1 Tax=Thamnophis elegans TaxID=35005 RepID=UPI00137698B4|nr:C5a anaphylatoxin chemotactic receptor 1 [Thamnophis elegans]
MDYPTEEEGLPDISDYDYLNTTEIPLSMEESSLSPIILVAIVLYALVFLVGTLGNGAVIWVVGFQMQRTVSSVWFLNLSVADLLCCLSLPVLAVSLGSENHWVLGDFACKLLPSIVILNMFASILLLALISMDRCALVLKPIWCQNHRSTRLAWKLCGAAWGFATFLTLPSFVTRRTQYYEYHRLTLCVVDYGLFGVNHQTAEVSVAATRFLTGFLIPSVALSLFYGLLALRVHSSRFMRSKRTLKMVLVVVVAFFACWAPYHVIGLILASQTQSSPLFQSLNQLDPLTVALASTNSCINPVIYVIAGQNFKARICRSLSAVLRNVLNEEVSRTPSQAREAAQGPCTTTEDQSTNTTV